MQEPPDDSPSSANATNSQVSAYRDEPMYSSSPTGEPKRVPSTELAQLLLLTCLGSLIMLSYVWVVNKYTVHRVKVDIVENAAVLAARELAEITVQHSSLGAIGLCDMEQGQTLARGVSRIRAMGIDRVYETLRVDQEIAAKLQHQLIQKLVKNDRELARKLEQELAQKLRQAVEPDSTHTTITSSDNKQSFREDQDNNVYRDVHRMIASDREAQQASSIEVKISLGRAKSPIYARDCDAHSIDASNFDATSDDHSPYLVQVEVNYERKNDRPLVVRRCALIAAPNVEPAPAALVINFPLGVPPVFNSAYDILSYKSWVSQGDWQQAVGSNVPGNGSLAPPLGSVMPSMSPGDALAVGLYDWLKTCGPGIDSNRAVDLIKDTWDFAPLAATAQHLDEPSEAGERSAVNSCLARDTGAREYSIMNQTAPGSTGQVALARAFSIYDHSNQGLRQSLFPQSALPLFVGKDGKCTIAGRRVFDQELVRDFLSSVQQTNLAAISSLATAKQLVSATNVALNQLEQKMFIEKQELASVSARLSRLEDVAKKVKPSGKDSKDRESQHFIDLSKDRIATLNAIVEADEHQRKKFQRMHRLAVQATVNATKIATSTFDLGAHSLKFCRNGIYRLDGPNKSFLVGTQFVFAPLVEPLSETDFASIESQKAFDASPDIQQHKSPWLAENLAALLSVQTAFPNGTDSVKVEGRSLTQLMQSPPSVAMPPSGMIVLNSDAMRAGAAGRPDTNSYRQYAFANIPIPPGQLLYYCQNAVQTGDKPKVAWSVLLRDMVASKGAASTEEPVGNPIASNERNWCHNKDSDRCPGLACEIQVRCPLPVLDKMIEDAYIKNPTTNEQVQQIPPVPPDML